MQAETRYYMRDHCKATVCGLRHKYINDIMYSDTLFSGIMSLRGYKCFQMFAYKYSKFDKLELMRCASNYPEAYEDVIDKLLHQIK